ncbi:hypothetical protein VTG60DRAFT_3404 [Thermothelomyces hinnuleus]
MRDDAQPYNVMDQVEKVVLGDATLDTLWQSFSLARNVSVFNWTGMDMGSPIRGRSLYPSSHAAYGNPEDRVRRYNLLLAERVQDKMDDVVATAIRLLKDRKRNDLPFQWIERIVQLIQHHSFKELKPLHEAFGKIVGYVAEYYEKERERVTREKEIREKEAKTAEPATATPDKGFSLRKIPTIPSVPSSVTSLAPSSLQGFRGSSSSSMKDKEDNSSSSTKKKGSSFGLVKSVKTPSFGGFSSKKGGTPVPSGQEEPVAAAAEGPSPAAAATPPSDQPTDDAVSDPPPPYLETETPPPPAAAAQSSWWHALDKEVMEYLTIPASEGASKALLPAEIQSVKIQLDDQKGEDKRNAAASSAAVTAAEQTDNNAREAAAAAFQKQHSSEGHRGPDNNNSNSNNDNDEDEYTISPNPIVVTNAGIEGLFDVQRVVVTMLEPDRLRRRIARAGGRAARRRLGLVRQEDEDENNMEEERRVQRMIEFVQEPRLELFELGAAPGVFHGRRIASGAIDFGGGSAAPEPGLVGAWRAYMDRKRRKMCYVVRDYLRSRMDARQGEQELKEGASLARQGLDMAVRGLGYGSEAELSAAAEAGEREKRGGRKDEGKEDEEGRGGDSGGGGYDDEKGSDGEREEDVLGKVLAQAKLAGKALGKYTVLAVEEKLLEMHGDRLDETLATAVLKRTPKSLRTAVESMEDNGSFLPAMYHSSTRIHMF